MTMQIKRSSTGKYHLGNAMCGHADCNQNMRTNPSTVSMAKSAPEFMLCEKCFSGGYNGHAQLNLLIEIGSFECADDKPMRFKMSHGPDGDLRMSRQN